MTDSPTMRRPSSAAFHFVSVELDFMFSMLDSVRAAVNPAQKKQFMKDVERAHQEIRRMLPHLHLYENQEAMVKRRFENATRDYQVLRNSLRDRH